MIHYLGYDANGQFRSFENGNGFWDTGFDLDSPNPTHPLAIQIKTWRDAHDPPIVGFIQWDCGMQPGYQYGNQIHPACTAVHTCYYDIANQLIMPKPQISLVINDYDYFTIDAQCANSIIPIDLPPQTLVTAKFAEADTGGVPDGSCIEIENSGNVTMMQEETTTVIFNGGVSDEFQLHIPAQGVKSYMNLLGCHIMTTTLAFRGWPTTG